MRFFLDTSDGRRFYRDDTGEDYPSVVSAYHAATIALAELAQDNLPDNGSERDLSVAVRNHRGEPLFTVSLSFRLTVTAPPNAERLSKDLGLPVAPPKP